ncbi:MAG: PAS domain-containing protein [Bacillota bacterium]
MNGDMPQQIAPTAPDGQPLAPMLDRVSEAFAVLDRSWRFAYLNKAAEQLLQHERQELLGKDLWQVFPQSVGSTFDQEFRRAVEQNIEVRFETFCHSLGLWLRVLAYPSPAGLSTHFQDITDRRQTELEQHRHQQELTAILENAPDVIARFDRECRYLYINRRIEQITGRPIAQMIGKRKHEPHLPADFCHLWEERLREAMEQRREVVFEFDGPTLIGHRHYQARLIPEYTADGNVESVLSITRDITELKRAHAAASEREQRLRAIFDNATAAMYIKDPQGRYLSINRFLEELLQTPRERLVGQTDYELFPREIADLLRANDQRVLASHVPLQFEETVSIAGTTQTYLTVKFPLFDAGGRAYAVCGMSTDITERKRAVELNAAKQAAEAANAAKDQFLAILSHELRTPLTPVLMLASAMEQRSDLPLDLKENLGIIRQNAELEARLIGDLLDVTRIRRGKLEIRPEITDTHASLRQTLQMLQSNIAAKQLDCLVDLKADYPFVHADPARLQQVFWNVIGNAVKFTPSRGRILIQSNHPREGLLRITITDTGIGIEPQALPRIFSAFEQAEPQITRSYGGLGLGLTISKALLEMQGGNITAQSEGPGKGSTFTVDLPTVSEQPAEAKPPAGPHRPVTGMRILLVEDHGSTAQVMSHLLTSLGHTVWVSNSVHHALELAREHPLDLVISDLALPDASGLDLMRQIKSQYNVKGISLSGYGRPEDVAGSQAAGFAIHLIKPIDLPKLVEAIDRVCQ